MGKKISIINNDGQYGISMGLFLANDTYDHNPVLPDGIDGPIISATTLLKPTRSLVLGSRVQEKDAEVNLSSLADARIGQSVHHSIEMAFSSPNRDEILEKLGFAPGLIRNLRLDPTQEELAADPDIIPIYLEHRAFRKVKTSSGVSLWISGKFDQVIGGGVEDNKITKVYSYQKMDQTEKSDYARQQSIYRWLNPGIITSDIGKINFVFKDWKAGDAARTPGYPPRPVMEMPVELASLQDTERFIIRKLDQLEMESLKNEQDLVECSEDELWKTPDKYKYFAGGDTSKKATRSFDSMTEAQAEKTKRGKGVIKVFPGEVRRCSYCDGAPLCTQRLEYT